jgi:hypothetical protein
MDSKEQNFYEQYPLYAFPTTPQTPTSHNGSNLGWHTSYDNLSRTETATAPNTGAAAAAAQTPPQSQGPMRQLLLRGRPIGSLLWMFLVFVVFSLLHCLFIYYVLIRGNVIIGSAIFDASTTNLLVSIFSQASAILADTTLRQLLGALRLSFATSANGTSAFTWFGIGLSSQWVTTAKFAAASYLMNIWCLLRLLLPLLNLGFGSVLKFQADFDYYFVPNSVEVPVYAGLIPVDVNLLKVVPVPELCQYFTTWSSSLQVNSRYSTEISMPDCDDDNCRSLLWPGGLETVRQVAPYLNTSLFHDGHFENSDAVQIPHARGFTTTFRDLDQKFTFDYKTDCVFGGLSLDDDAFKICVKQVGDDVAAGWAPCPQRIKDLKRCQTDNEWKNAPMKAQVQMGVHRQYTTTTYSRQNLSILHVERELEPERMALAATTYADIFEQLLIPKVMFDKEAEKRANTSIASLTYALGWVHRVYGDIFKNEEHTLVTVLENFLTIPLQFAVTSRQLGNYTSQNNPALLAIFGNFSMPDEMITTAMGGTSIQRLVIKDWTGWVFIAADGVVLCIVLLGIFSILRQREPLPTLTGLTELDILIEAERMVCMEETTSIPLKKLPIVTGKESSAGYTNSLKPWRLRWLI